MLNLNENYDEIRRQHPEDQFVKVGNLLLGLVKATVRIRKKSRGYWLSYCLFIVTMLER